MDSVYKNILPGLAAILAIAAAGLQYAGPHGYGLVALLAAGVAGCVALVGQNPRLGVLASSAGAAAANGYLFYRKLHAAGDAACKINETFDCDKINMSAWSAVNGIPITLFGLAFYVGLAMAGGIAKDDDSKRLFQMTTLFSVLNVGVSLFLGSQMFVEKAICVVCIFIYLMNALLLWAGLSGLRKLGTTVSSDLGALFPSVELGLLGGGGVVVFAVGLTQVLTPAGSAGGGGQTGASTDLTKVYQLARGSVELDGTEPVIGDAKAPFQVVEFADFACPHCAMAAKEVPGLLEKHPKMNLRFKTYALTGECNPKLSPGREPVTRCDAAYAADCARQQNRFWDMEQMLFANQGYFAAEDLRYMAEQLGLDVPKWQECLANPATRAGIIADANAGNRAGVAGTPSFFVRGLPLQGVSSDTWVEITNGPPGLDAVLTAAEAGGLLPTPPPAPPESE
jgi:protein-disulfide isomerase/uncharacterized membrane protein